MNADGESTLGRLPLGVSKMAAADPSPEPAANAAAAHPALPGQDPTVSGSPTPIGAVHPAAPISQPRVKECLESASFWAEILAYHADGLQKRADTWSISAGLLAAVAGLSAWKLVTDQKDVLWAILATSILALAAGVSALVPRIKNYAENAALSRELAARYGQSKGVLINTFSWMSSPNANDAVVRAVVSEFETIKKSKDSMRYVPVRSDETRNALLRKKSLSHNMIGRKTLRVTPTSAQGSVGGIAVPDPNRVRVDFVLAGIFSVLAVLTAIWLTIWVASILSDDATSDMDPLKWVVAGLLAAIFGLGAFVAASRIRRELRPPSAPESTRHEGGDNDDEDSVAERTPGGSKGKNSSAR